MRVAIARMTPFIARFDRRRNALSIFFALLIWGFAVPLHAACTSPSAPAGSMNWNGTGYQYCDGTTWQYFEYNASHLSTGTVPTARLGSGSATSSTYLRGDQTWATPSAGGSVDTQTFTSSGTWTKPTATITRIQCWGGGAGGSSGGNWGGGGGGGYNEKFVATASMGSTETVTIGAGGAHGTTGSSGGNSSVGSWLTAYGGAGAQNGGGGGGPGGAASGTTPGAPLIAQSSIYEGGGGGAGTGNGAFWHGGAGGNCTPVGYNCNAANGGGSVWGGGGGSGSGNGGSGGPSLYGGAGGGTSANGTQPGGGGGGRNNAGSAPGDGAAGKCVVTSW